MASLVQWSGISYNDVPYPGFAEFFGWMLAIASMIMVPIFALIQFYQSKGTTLTEVSACLIPFLVSKRYLLLLTKTYIVFY